MQLAYLVSDSKHPNNYPIYSIHEYFGSCMSQLNYYCEGILQVEKDRVLQTKIEMQDDIWHMFFYESSCKEGAKVGVVLISPAREIIYLMYKLEFQTTNNIVEYEALIPGLRAAKYLNIQQLTLFGDSELII